MPDIERPTFTQPRAQKVWQDYLHQVDGLCGLLNSRQKADIRMEIRAHLLDSFIRQDSGDEVSRIGAAIDKLGQPREFVPLWVEERLLDGAQPGATTRNMFLLLQSNALKGIQQFPFSMLVGFGYMLSFYFFFMSIMKIFFPENVGLYLSTNGIPFLGYVDADEFTELLGNWLIPTGLASTFILQITLNRLVRRWVNHFNNPRSVARSTE